MIDLHNHILPGIDDGAKSIEVSLDMARAWVADGVTAVACTPHILPGAYHITGPQIRTAVAALRVALAEQGIPLTLFAGSDNHVAPDMVARLRAGDMLSIADSRYVLVEPPHHVPPPRLKELFFTVLLAGYIPVFTHPERLSWIRAHYDDVAGLAQAGVWIQITAGSLIGNFGREARYVAERMLDDGLVHVIASDAHDATHRAPALGEGRRRAALRLGEEAAEHLVMTRPKGVVENQSPSVLPPAVGVGPVERGQAIDVDQDQHSASGRSSRARARSGQVRAGGAGDRPRASLLGRLRRLLG